MSLVVLWLLAAEPVVSTVPCKTVAECWLDDEGKPIARPRSKKGRPLPRGDCSGKILWLRHELSCQQNVCVSLYVGDRC